jgi:hypothetical protein
MGRVVDRLSYKEMAQARLASRVKQFFVLIMVVIAGILVSVSVNAQRKSIDKNVLTNGAGKCRMLKSTKTHQPKYKGRLDGSRKTASLQASEVAVTPGSELGSSENSAPSQGDDVLKAQIALTSSVDFTFIREMVASHLKEYAGSDPIELAPLYFNGNNGKLSAVDINPLLIAIEFGIQGKIIVIDNISSEGAQLSALNISQISELMQGLGVPAERILIADNSTASAASFQNTRIGFKAF